VKMDSLFYRESWDTICYPAFHATNDRSRCVCVCVCLRSEPPHHTGSRHPAVSSQNFS